MFYQCTKGGVHNEEPLNIVCLEQECIQTGEYVLCIACRTEEHKKHQCVHLNDFYKLLDQKSNLYVISQDRKNQIENQQNKCIQMLNRVQTQIIQAIKDITTSCQKYYSTLLQNINNDDIKNDVKIIESYEIKHLKSINTFKDKIGKAIQFINQQGLFDKDIIVQQSETYQLDIMTQIKAILMSVINFKNKLDTGQQPIHKDLEEAQLLKEMANSKRISDFKLSQTFRQTNRSFSLNNPVVQQQQHFNSKMIHKGISLKENIAQSLEDQVAYKMLFVHEYADSLPLQDKMWKFKIIKCPNYNLNYPLAIGFCYYDVVQKNGMIFNGGNDISTNSNKNINHGCFLINCMGISRNCITQKEEKKNVGLRFNSGDYLELWYRPFTKQMVLIRQTVTAQKEEASLTLPDTSGFKLVPCIRMNYQKEAVKIL